MSIPPEDDPLEPEQAPPPREDSLTEEEVLAAVNRYFPYDVPEFVEPEQAPAPGRRLLAPAPVEARTTPRPPRIPHIGDVFLLGVLMFAGWVGSAIMVRFALYYRLWGISTYPQANTDVHYTVFSIVTLYLIAFGGASLIFPVLWRKGLFSGLQWNGASALRRIWLLLGAAGICFLFAIGDEILLPGPTNAPIDKLFDNRAAAWLLFGYGVTFAPFFEEIIFRGFLLPAFSTAFDWVTEKATHKPARPLDDNGQPQWSIAAMIFASVVTSVPFALMHAEQTAWSLGPFLLLVCVSLVLCWARLATRSLAASVLVHAAYNFLLFSLMLLGTSGFKHLDRM